MELHLCMGCMREKTTPGPCPYCGFSEENYHPLTVHLPLYTILNGKYLVGKVLGHGGFGITYLGYDLNLRIKLAIKEYFPGQNVWRDTSKSARISLYSGNREGEYRDGLSKFLGEAQILAKFWDVPGIVPVKDYFQENNTAYIVMKFVEGKNLKQYLDGQGGKMEPARVFAMMAPLMDALSSVHRAGLIHGDISPKNVIMGPNDQLCLIDFGAATIIDDGTSNPPIFEFTPGYAPPEQYGGRGQLGPWSDIYALCATIYRAITGVLLPDALNRYTSLQKGTDTMKKPSQLGIALSRQQEEALIRGLAPEKEKRFSSIEELQEALYAPQKKTQNNSHVKAAAITAIIAVSGISLLSLGVIASRGSRLLKLRQREQNVLMADIVDVDEDEEFMVFGSDISRTEISRIIFTDNLSDAGENCWDVSEAQDEGVMAWTMQDGDQYELYIGGEGGVKLNPDGDSLFAGYDHVTSIDFNDCVDASGMLYMGEMFYKCGELKELDLSAFETADNITLYYTFFQCSSLEELDVSGLDTSGCQEMTGTFRGCSGLTELDVSNFDTSQVKNMAQMFMECGRLSSLDVGNFDTSQVTNMKSMFDKCFSLSSLDICSFDTSQVTDMTNLFEGCANLKSLELGALDTSQVTSFSSMFDGCQNLTQLDLTTFDTAQCQDFGWMFASCFSLEDLDLGSFNTENALNMSSMFNGCDSLTMLDLTSFDTSKVTDMSRMFALCSSLQKLDVSTFDTARVTDISYMFYGCSQLEELLVGDWDIDNVKKLDDVFTGSPWE